MKTVMRKKLLLAIAFSLGIWSYVIVLSGGPRRGSAAPPPQIKMSDPDEGIVALFSPSGGCTLAVISEINKAKKTLDIQAYSFTSPAIAQAVVDAEARGVNVRVVLDKSQRIEHNSSAMFLAVHHVPVFIDERHAIAHNKVVLIDGQCLITGSFNFTKAAEEQNAENLLILHDRPAATAAYEANFEHHLGHSVPLVPAVQ